MASILHLRKELLRPPVALSVADVAVRTITVPDDVPAWLALRDRAMAVEVPRVRPWIEQDFSTEMLRKPWWRTDWTWLSRPGELRLAGPARRSSPGLDEELAEATVVGAVTLALRQGAATSVPIIHWLLVDPAWRRRGIGRLLVAHLEQAAWNAGWREVQLETHAGWTNAVAFYQSMGYAPVRDRSPR